MPPLDEGNGTPVLVTRCSAGACIEVMAQYILHRSTSTFQGRACPEHWCLHVLYMDDAGAIFRRI
jgi:hypothetical protein